MIPSKICIVTGSNTGVGKELARILYAKNAKVYVAARSEVKAKDAIEDIKRSAPSSKGELVFLHLDLNDLSTIKASAQNFLAKENRLHILFNNAGVMMPPRGSKTAQGYELQLGVNNIAPFMFTKLLTPVIVSTARVESQNTVRVIWVSSSAAEVLSPKSIIPMDNLDYHIDQSSEVKYGISKAGNYLHAAEFAKRHKADGIISVALNPGNLSSDLVRHQGTFTKLFLKVFIQYPTVYGAYTELFAGLSPEVTIERSADWSMYLRDKPPKTCETALLILCDTY